MENQDVDSEKRRKAREKFKPKSVKWLLVAEAPPGNPDRYFYYEEWSQYDDLFNEVIHSIYRYEFPEISVKSKRVKGPIKGMKPNREMIRPKKTKFLCLLKTDGFHLIDAVDRPLTKEEKKHCKQVVLDNIEDLEERMTSISTKETRVILIKESVCALKDNLVKRGFRVVNPFDIQFPNNSRQPNFRMGMHKVLKPYFKERKGKQQRQLDDLDSC
jgi:hypothetical protein